MSAEADESGASGERRAVVVLGMHRSGTSALARAISGLGFSLPRDVMPPQPDNPLGFWEPRGVVRLNEQILQALGSGWNNPGLWLCAGMSLGDSRRIVHAHMQREWGERALTALSNAYPGQSAIILKDPRICLLLPLWKTALEAAGYKARFILIVRNPLEVAASLRERNGMGARLAFQLWLRYVLATLDPVTGVLPDSVVHYEHLLREPEAVLAAALAAVDAPAVERARLAETSEILRPDERHHVSNDAAVQTFWLLPPLLRKTWHLLGEARENGLEARTEELRSLWDEYESAALLASPLLPFRPAPAATAAKGTSVNLPSSSPSGGQATGATGSRPLVLHYHLFKNAGTSVDEMLKHNFGERWEQREFTTHGAASNADEVQSYLESRPDLAAFSSHTACLPPPQLAGRDVFPIIFLRHPIDRIRSAYDFERRQVADTFGAVLAKQESFPGYVRKLLEKTFHRQARNFQTFRLAFGQPPERGSELERAKLTVASLPFIGLVEAYEDSLRILQERLAPLVPDFRAISSRKNVTQQEDHGLAERLDRIGEELGPELNASLWDANRDDLELFDSVSKLYGR